MTPSRDRAIVGGALAAIVGLSWAWMLLHAHGMPGMTEMAGMATAAAPAHWSAPALTAGIVMWWVMMAGMMLPSAAPMILTFATVNRRRRERGNPFVPTAVFAAGYLVAWGGFSIVATLAQAGLQQAALLSPSLATTTPVLGGLLFLAAGAYQFSSLKHACLRHCRTPIDFVLNRWRDGAAGALMMGVEHGLYCLGCCWVVMALLFVGGAMNLLWAAALTVLVLVEKIAPGGGVVARLAGGLMIGFGAFLLLG
jgi:predicted metal-binding membrane protein